MKEITKAQLIDIIQECARGNISADALQEWMIDNYDPTEVKIGQHEFEHTIDAMNIVMNEYELVDIEKISCNSFRLAVQFIESSAAEHDDARNAFIRNGFVD